LHRPSRPQLRHERSLPATVRHPAFVRANLVEQTLLSAVLVRGRFGPATMPAPSGLTHFRHCCSGRPIQSPGPRPRLRRIPRTSARRFLR